MAQQDHQCKKYTQFVLKPGLRSPLHLFVFPVLQPNGCGQRPCGPPNRQTRRIPQALFGSRTYSHRSSKEEKTQTLQGALGGDDRCAPECLVMHSERKALSDRSPRLIRAACPRFNSFTDVRASRVSPRRLDQGYVAILSPLH